MPSTPFPVRKALGFCQRLLGLMGQAEPATRCALFIAHCTSVHTCFMRRPIDLVYLDAQGRITGLRPALAPWRGSRGEPGCAHVLEMRAGAIGHQALAPGMQLLPWPIAAGHGPWRARFAGDPASASGHQTPSIARR